MNKVIENATGRLRVDAILKSANTVETSEIGNDAPKSVSRTVAGARTDAEDVSMLGAVRRMLGFAINGAFDRLEGHKHSENMDRLEELRQEIAGKLATIPANDGNTDFALLIRHGRDSFEKFNKSIQHEVTESIYPGTEIELVKAALERVKNSAIAAGASLGMIELNISNV